MTVNLIPVAGIGEVHPGDDLAEIILAATQGRSFGADNSTGDVTSQVEPSPIGLVDGDVIVVTQKVVSKAEGRLVAVNPKDPRSHKVHVEAEAVRILRRRGDLIMTETRHGFICANSGVDLSNVEDGWAALLPIDPDRSARRIRDGLAARSGLRLAVIVSDTFGRTWRRGVTDVAIGTAGIAAVVDLRGTRDALGRELAVTEVCIADELAGAAELVMGKASGIPVAIVRGVDSSWLRESSVREEIVRPHQEDLFR